MIRRVLSSIGAVLVAITVMSMAAVSLSGQAGSSSTKAAGTAGTVAKSWKAPRTADGQPDLQGVWSNNNATPLERPAALAGKQVLTDQELAALKETAEQLFNGDGDAAFGDSVFEAALARAKGFTSRDAGTGNYNHFWLVPRDFDNRTSLIVDPPDGRLPARTPETQARARERRGLFESVRAEGGGRGYDSWEDRSLSERCITFGAPRLGAGYNSYYQIFQSPDHVAIVMETIHDARIIPLDGRPHVGRDLRQWLGDSRGRWQGDTLVVETTNYSPKSNVQGASEHVKVVERFTRVAPDTLKYEITMNDPATWTKPWTAMIPLRRTTDKVYEFACHEGNLGMEGILSGARALEKAAVPTSGK